MGKRKPGYGSGRRNRNISWCCTTNERADRINCVSREFPCYSGPGNSSTHSTLVYSVGHVRAPEPCIVHPRCLADVPAAAWRTGPTETIARVTGIITPISTPLGSLLETIHHLSASVKFLQAWAEALGFKFKGSPTLKPCRYRDGSWVELMAKTTRGI